MTCKCARKTDEFHGWACGITGGACMFVLPDSKLCAKVYGEGPDSEPPTDTPVSEAPEWEMFLKRQFERLE